MYILTILLNSSGWLYTVVENPMDLSRLTFSGQVLVHRRPLLLPCLESLAHLRRLARVDLKMNPHTGWLTRQVADAGDLVWRSLGAPLPDKSLHTASTLALSMFSSSPTMLHAVLKWRLLDFGYELGNNFWKKIRPPHHRHNPVTATTNNHN